MYIDRKDWDIPQIAVKANYYQETFKGKTTTIIDRDILFLTPVDEEQKLRLEQIAKRCPISKILENDIEVCTFLFPETVEQKGK